MLAVLPHCCSQVWYIHLGVLEPEVTIFGQDGGAVEVMLIGSDGEHEDAMADNGASR